MAYDAKMKIERRSTAYHYIIQLGLQHLSAFVELANESLAESRYTNTLSTSCVVPMVSLQLTPCLIKDNHSANLTMSRVLVESSKPPDCA